MAFIDGTQILAISAEASGRMVVHNVTSYLSLTAKLAGKLSKLLQPNLLILEPPIGDVFKITGLRAVSNCPVQPPNPDVNSRTVIAHACEGMVLLIGLHRLCLGKL